MKGRTLTEPHPLLDVEEVSLLVVFLSNLLWADLPSLLSITFLCCAMGLGLMVLTELLIAVVPCRTSYRESRIYWPEKAQTPAVTVEPGVR